jgi:hypothetical protein
MSPSPPGGKVSGSQAAGEGGFMSRQAGLSPLPQLHHNQSASLHNLPVQEMGKKILSLWCPPTFFFSFFRSLFLSIAFSQMFLAHEPLGCCLLQFFSISHSTVFDCFLSSYLRWPCNFDEVLEKECIYIHKVVFIVNIRFYFVILLLYSSLK